MTGSIPPEGEERGPLREPLPRISRQTSSCGNPFVGGTNGTDRTASPLTACCLSLPSFLCVFGDRAPVGRKGTGERGSCNQTFVHLRDLHLKSPARAAELGPLDDLTPGCPRGGYRGLGPRHRGGTIRGTELLIDPKQVRLGRAVAHVQPQRDLGDREPGGGEREDLLLAQRQDRIRGRRLPQRVHERPLHLFRQERLAPEERTERRDERPGVAVDRDARDAPISECRE